VHQLVSSEAEPFDVFAKLIIPSLAEGQQFGIQAWDIGYPSYLCRTNVAYHDSALYVQGSWAWDAYDVENNEWDLDEVDIGAATEIWVRIKRAGNDEFSNYYSLTEPFDEEDWTEITPTVSGDSPLDDNVPYQMGVYGQHEEGESSFDSVVEFLDNWASPSPAQRAQRAECPHITASKSVKINDTGQGGQWVAARNWVDRTCGGTGYGCACFVAWGGPAFIHGWAVFSGCSGATEPACDYGVWRFNYDPEPGTVHRGCNEPYPSWHWIAGRDGYCVSPPCVSVMGCPGCGCYHEHPETDPCIISDAGFDVYHWECSC
jgi:hypothetical protein